MCGYVVPTCGLRVGVPDGAEELHLTSTEVTMLRFEVRGGPRQAQELEALETVADNLEVFACLLHGHDIGSPVAREQSRTTLDN